MDMQTFREQAMALGGISLRLLGLLFVLPACSDGPYLQTEEYVTKAGQAEDYMGGGCVAVQEGNGMGGGTAPIPIEGEGGESGEEQPLVPGYSFSYEGTGNSVHFTVSDGYGAVLVERDYDSDFLLSGKKDEISVDVTGGSMRFIHWGGAKCQEPRSPSE